MKQAHTGRGSQLWENSDEVVVGVLFSEKLCCSCGCDVNFPKIVVVVVVGVMVSYP